MSTIVSLAFSLKQTVFIVVLAVLAACQTLHARSTETNIENLESQTLKILIAAKDIPGNASWSLIHTNQPSRAEWLIQENLLDSASNYLKGDYWITGKRYYISIFHNVAQYSGSAPEAELAKLHSVFDKSEEIELHNLKRFGNKTIAKCFDSEIYYDCTVIVSYPSIESNVTIIASKELGVHEMELLLNSVLKANDKKVFSFAQE